MHLVIDREDADVRVGCASADIGEDVGNGRGCAVRVSRDDGRGVGM
jgi:hypothetical protein